MKICIIDSGIEKRFLERDNIIGGKCFHVNNPAENADILESDNYFDDESHGTCVFRTLNLHETRDEYYIIKVLNCNKACSSQVLIRALEFASELDVKAVILCLATVSTNHRKELEFITEKLASQGKILISSLHNKYSYSYPAVFNSCIGVKGVPLARNIYHYSKGEAIQVICNSLKLFMFTHDLKLVSFGGNSKAAALFAGLSRNVISIASTKSEFEALLNKETTSIDYIMKYDALAYFEHATYPIDAIDHNTDFLKKAELSYELFLTCDYQISFNDFLKYPLWILVNSREQLSSFVVSVCSICNKNPLDIILSVEDLLSISKLIDRLSKL